MGINGLLRNLHPLLVPPPSHHTNRNNTTQKTPVKIRHNIQQFASKSLAVDASSWLFKSAYTCSERLVEAIERGVRDPIAEQKYTAYMISRCRELLQRAKIARIYLVFDGIRVPLKADTNAERESKRRVNLAEARKLVSMGRREEARERYNKCVKGTEEMARVVCAEVEKVFGRGDEAKVKCVFSPYEADAQLAKLCVDGICHAVVTEDSDVLVYSAACRRPFPIIYKLDRKDGSCDVVTMDWLLNPNFLPPSRRNRRKQRDDSDDSDSEDEKSNSVEDIIPENNTTTERHCSEIDYGDDDNMIYAPIRRTLPPPLSNIPTSKSNSRARRSTSTKDGTTGTAFLQTLRSFAHKEAIDPGSGCRLFIQACVLSGCDYVPNRLAKVGPVTAFKLVKDSSHRKHEERFDRVMKALPRGVILQTKASEENLDEDDDENDEEDFLSSCNSSSDAKEKYLELLTKSEAVFYYHLVKEKERGTIVPLVPHNRTVSTVTNLKTAGSPHPSITNFNSDLSFIGSAEEAIKNNPLAAPPCPRNQSESNVQHHSSGWINTKRPAGGVNNSNKKQSAQPKKDAKSQVPFKGTLQYAFSHPNNRLKGQTTILQCSSSTTTSHSIAASKQSNTLASLAYDLESKVKHKHNSTSLTITTPNVSDKTTTKRPPSTSPFFSPMGRVNKFDYDYLEAPSAEKETSKLQSSDTHELEGLHNHATPNISTEENSTEKLHVPSSTPNKSKTDNTFDYEIIVESPPVIEDCEKNYSKYFNQSRNGSPRRVSTSPSYKPNSYGDGISPEYAIDLNDEPDSPKKPNSEVPLSSQTSNLSKSSVNKRPFKSPYPSINKSEAVSRKKPRQPSSGALLAGFAIQRENASEVPWGTRQRMAARNINSKKNKAKGTLSIQGFLKRK